MKKEEYIVCSAVHHLDGNIYMNQPVNIDKGIVVCGLRHHNCIATLASLDQNYYKKVNKKIQGFLTSKNRFVDRYEAYRIHFKTDISKELFSEDLY